MKLDCLKLVIQILGTLAIASCAHTRQYGTTECVSADENNVIRSIGVSQGHHTRTSITFRADGTLESQTVYPNKPELGAYYVTGWATTYDRFGSVINQHTVQLPWTEDGTR